MDEQSGRERHVQTCRPNFVNCMNRRVLRRRSASCPTDRADTALPTAIWRCGFWAIRKSATTSARGKSGEIGLDLADRDTGSVKQTTTISTQGRREGIIKSQDLRKFSTRREIFLFLTP